MTDILSVFEFNLPEMVAIVGSGGKTSLMFSLAKAAIGRNLRVLTTTTTKIWIPTAEQSSKVILASDLHVLWAEAQVALEKHPHVTMAVSGSNDGKLIGVPPALIDDLYAEKDVDLVLVEADGARGLPLKASGTNEPVIPDDATVVVPVIGLSGLGKPLSGENTFRPERFARMAEMEVGGLVQPEHLARVLFHKDGICRDVPSLARIVPFLNQADTVTREDARAVAEMVLKHAPDQVDRVVWGSLQHPEHGFESLTEDDL